MKRRRPLKRLTFPRFWVDIDVRKGFIRTPREDDLTPPERNAVTAVVLDELRRHGWDPDPLAVRDALFQC